MVPRNHSNQKGAFQLAGNAKNLGAKLFDDRLTRGYATAEPEKGTYEFGTELTEGGGLSALKNVTYGASGQQTAGARRGKQGR